MKYPVTSVAVIDDLRLNVTKECLSRTPSWLEFNSPIVRQLPTATGFVSSVEPSASARLVLNLKDGPVASDWLTRWSRMMVIESLSVTVRGSIIRSLNLASCVISNIHKFDDGASAMGIVIDGRISSDEAIAITAL